MRRKERDTCRYCGKEIVYNPDYKQYETENNHTFYCHLATTTDQWHEPE